MGLEKAIVMHRQGKMKEAEDNYLQALNEDFNDIDTLYLLGSVYATQGKAGLAATLLRRAIDLKPDHFEALNNLGNCHKMQNNEAEAEKCFLAALKIPGKSDRDYADIHNNLCALHINNGDPELGLPHARKAIALKPDHIDANWNLALLELERGNYAAGFDLYKWGFKTKNRIYRDYGRDLPYWDGSKGKNVIVWGEQGIGDELMYASMLPDLIKVSKNVIFDCHPNLLSIFRQSFPQVAVYPTRKDAYIEWPSKHPEADAKVAIGDLGVFFRGVPGDFPKHDGYLKADPKRVEFYKAKLAKLGRRPKVGIIWTGGYAKTRKDYRSVPLEKWAGVLALPADFISLQYTPEAYSSISDIEETLDIRIHHWPSAVQEGKRRGDYGETAALVSALDLVITINTSIHHLAGGLGVPCWTLTPKGKAWRYWSPDGITNPWYPSVVQYENKEHNNWDKVMDDVRRDLDVFLTMRREEPLKAVAK